MVVSLAHWTRIPSWGAVAWWWVPLYDVGRKWLVAPKSSAPSAGRGGRLSQRLLQAFKAAGKHGDVVGLLGLKSNRTVRGHVCGTKWKLVLDLVIVWVLHERAILVRKLGAVSLVLTLFTNFGLQINRPLPISQSTALSQIELSPGLHHFIHRWSRFVFPPIGFAFVAFLLWLGPGLKQSPEL